MRYFHFIKDRGVSLAILLLALVASGVMLKAFGLDWAGIAFMEAVFVAAALAALTVDYARRARFYNELNETLETLDQKTLITAVLKHPDFLEGQIIYDTLAEATKSMNDAIARYRLSSNEYREFIETWVHEIKTPIAAARLTIENNPSELASTFSRELADVEGYVEQALYFTRSAAVENDYHIKEVPLSEIVGQALRANKQALIDSAMALDVEDIDCRVYADSKWAAFVVGQIIGNTIKYRRTTNNAPLLQISARQFDAGLSSVRTVLTIADNGIGISEADISRVFNKGFTGENGRAFVRSTGIGLYLCKKLCDKMGLGIGLTSQQNQGTSVTITFPQNKLYFVEKPDNSNRGESSAPGRR